MNSVFDQPSAWRRFKPVFAGFDPWLALAVALLAALGLVTMYSAGYDHGTRFVDHGRNMVLALVVIFLVAQISPQAMMRFALPLYVIGVALLVAVAVMGVTKKGARRRVLSSANCECGCELEFGSKASPGRRMNRRSTRHHPEE